MPFTADQASDDAALREILLAMAEARLLPDLLPTIVQRLAGLDAVALARVWLVQPGDICATCLMRGECATRVPCLHLVASAGASRVDGADWSGVEGDFRRFPIGVRKVGHIAATGAGVTVADVRSDPQWIARPEWVEREGIVGFGGKALVARGEILGVLAVFTRTPYSQAMCAWTQILAAHAAADIAGARAFAEVERLGRRLAVENDLLKEELIEAGAYGDIIGDSPAIRTVVERIELVAPTPAYVLVLGESGTGKELVAREIHQRSRRAGKPLVKVNCAAVPRDLFESEFFGHARGAFTGALQERHGRFAAADGGTLFLDEVGEIPLSLQGKLLRVLQEGEYERVGEERTRKVDVRIVAATNRDLAAEVAAKRFREDLYYRLNVIPITLPPLRERRGDIPSIAAHLLRRLGPRLGRPIPRLSRADADRLQDYAWPGNVRELHNVLERALITGRDGRLALDIPLSAPAAPAAPFARSAAEDGAILSEADLVRLERDNMRAVLARCAGRVHGPDGAAALLGIKATTLQSRLKKHGLR